MLFLSTSLQFGERGKIVFAYPKGTYKYSIIVSGVRKVTAQNELRLLKGARMTECAENTKN